VTLLCAFLIKGKLNCTKTIIYLRADIRSIIDYVFLCYFSFDLLKLKHILKMLMISKVNGIV